MEHGERRYSREEAIQLGIEVLLVRLREPSSILQDPDLHPVLPERIDGPWTLTYLEEELARHGKRLPRSDSIAALGKRALRQRVADHVEEAELETFGGVYRLLPRYSFPGAHRLNGIYTSNLLWQRGNKIPLPIWANNSCPLDPIVVVAKVLGAYTCQADAISLDRRIRESRAATPGGKARLAMRMLMEQYTEDIPVARLARLQKEVATHLPGKPGISGQMGDANHMAGIVFDGLPSMSYTVASRVHCCEGGDTYSAVRFLQLPTVQTIHDLAMLHGNPDYDSFQSMTVEQALQTRFFDKLDRHTERWDQNPNRNALGYLAEAPPRCKPGCRQIIDVDRVVQDRLPLFLVVTLGTGASVAADRKRKYFHTKHLRILVANTEGHEVLVRAKYRVSAAVMFEREKQHFTCTFREPGDSPGRLLHYDSVHPPAVYVGKWADAVGPTAEVATLYCRLMGTEQCKPCSKCLGLCYPRWAHDGYAPRA